MANIKYQIKAILKAVKEGKAKNQWVAANKIKALKRQLIAVQRHIKWDEYLSR